MTRTTDEGATPTGTPTGDPADVVETPVDTSDDPDEGRESAGKEAAKYRRRLRDTEAERDTLATQLDTVRRQVVASLVATQQRLPNPEALWATTSLENLLDENGAVDPDKVEDASTAAAQRFGIDRKPVGYVPSQGTADQSKVRSGGGWLGALMTPRR